MTTATPGITSATIRPAHVPIVGEKTELPASLIRSNGFALPWRSGMARTQFSKTTFGLTNGEGNHGEDVKEYYFYLDSTPTHSYMKSLYKYPQSAFPYDDLVGTNRLRGKLDLEYELIDTGSSMRIDTSMCSSSMPRNRPGTSIKISVHNRGPDVAKLQSCPRSGFATCGPGGQTAFGRRSDSSSETRLARSSPRNIPNWAIFTCTAKGRFRSCSRKTRPTSAIFGVPNRSPYVKDGINNYLALGQRDAVNPEGGGRKPPRTIN